MADDAHIDWREHHRARSSAEKDLAFALVALQDRQGAKAYLNVAAALAKLSRTLLDSEWRTVRAALVELKAAGQ